MRKNLTYGVLAGVFYLTSCLPNNTCDEIAKSFRDDEQFHLVLTEKNHKGREAHLYGIDLKYKQETEFFDDSGWIEETFDKFQIGDTLLKDLGKYTIIIKRGHKTIKIPYECEKFQGDSTFKKVYQDDSLKY